MSEPASPSAQPNPDSAPEAPLVPCRHLRFTGMYVYTDRSAHEHAESSSGGGGGNTSYWCVKTMKCFGPDRDVVDRAGCQGVPRTCYEPV